ncbi:Hypothetical_protein [Hexamita inflata]|uniref:Hypothetical_protein n=1 Tax=Hexamita inflata TaxID=28002 RepID=A0AA86TJG7_9EUKA|nr:Hypothetical protein HINF_LOCUS2493 [Hexamita inflata]
MRIWLVDVSACAWKQMRPRSVLKLKSSEKTSEFRFQEFCKAIQYLFTHLSWSTRVSQLVPRVTEESSFLSRNPAVEADENSETLFQFLEVDLEPVSPILAGPVCHNQSYPSRKRAALSCFLSKVIRVSFNDNYINMYLSYITSVSLIPLLTNEDDRRQQKEPAATLMQVRTERESTACFGQTRAVDVLVSAVTLMRLDVEVLHEVQAEQSKVMRIWLVDVSAYTWKQMRPRRVLKLKSSEKTSEFRFQEFCKAIQYLFIHLSQSTRVSQLVPRD